MRMKQQISMKSENTQVAISKIRNPRVKQTTLKAWNLMEKVLILE